MHGNHIRRGRTGALADVVDESLVVVRDDDASGKSTADEEDAESDIHRFKRTWECDARQLGFSGNHGHVLRSHNAETGRPQTSEKAAELFVPTTKLVTFKRSLSTPILLAKCDACGAA